MISSRTPMTSGGTRDGHALLHRSGLGASLVEHRKQLKLVEELIRKQEKILAKARTEAEIASHRDALHKLRTYREAARSQDQAPGTPEGKLTVTTGV